MAPMLRIVIAEDHEVVRRGVRDLLSGHAGWEVVAEALGISVKTVETHRANLMRKLEIASIVDVVRYAVRNRLVEA